MTTIGAIANNKGGTGKTTTTANLGHGLSRSGKRVLLIDFDSQGSLSLALGLDPAPSTQRLLLANDPLESVIISARPGLDLVRSNDTLADVRDWLAVKSGRDARSALRSLAAALAGNVEGYDFVLIDCGPGLDILTLNALMVAQWVLVPVSVDYLSAAGTAQHVDTIDSLRDVGGRAELKFIVPTFYDKRTNRSREILDLLTRTFGPLVTNPIRQNTRLAEAPHNGQTIFELDPVAAGAEDYNDLVKRVIYDTT